MTLTRTTIAYLDAMGIRAWERRREPRPDVAGEAVQGGSPGLDCLQAVQAPLASVVLHWSGPLSLGPAHPGGALLLKILGALNQPPEQFAVYQLTDNGIPDSLRLKDPGRAVFVFANGPPPVSGGPPVIGLPTLERMLVEPEAKRTAWSLLRPWIQKLG